MTSLNSEGLEKAFDILWAATEWNGGWHACRETVDAAITAYLSAIEAPAAPSVVTPDSNGHCTRLSDSSFYDEVCTLCGATDGRGDNSLDRPCPKRLIGD